MAVINNESEGRAEDRVWTGTAQDVVTSAGIRRGVPTTAVMVRSESDLSGLSGYAPGTIAYMAGYTHMWQLSAGGDWISMF